MSLLESLQSMIFLNIFQLNVGGDTHSVPLRVQFIEYGALSPHRKVFRNFRGYQTGRPLCAAV